MGEKFGLCSSVVLSLCVCVWFVFFLCWLDLF